MNDRKPSFQPVVIGLIAGAALLRLIPHPPNFAPIGALALFAGARLKGWLSYVVPLLAMLVTDPILSHMAGYSAFSPATVVIYSSLLLYVVLGKTFLQRSSKILAIGSVALMGSLQFFLVTNFHEWISGTFYAHTFAGLVTCYTAALPFFGYTVAGDLFYSAVLFSVYALLSRRSHSSHSNALAS